MGRPTKLTPELSAKLVALIEGGMLLEHAAAEVGIHRATLFRWLAEGEKEDADELYAEFCDGCERARARAERAVLDELKMRSEPGAGDWKACQWRLQFMNPRRFKPADKHEVTGAEGGPVKLDVTKLSDEELERIAAGGLPTPGGG